MTVKFLIGFKKMIINAWYLICFLLIFHTYLYGQDSIPSSRVYIIDPNDPIGYSLDQPTGALQPQNSTYYDLDALDVELNDRHAIPSKGLEYKETNPNSSSQEKIKNTTKKGPGISFSDMAKSLQKK